jgi:hypothetical protein
MNRKKIEVYSGLAILILAAGAIMWLYYPKPAINPIDTSGEITIEYSSGDSSLPPRFHREYIWVVAQDKLGRITGRADVKDYSKVLESRQASVSRETFLKILSEVQKVSKPKNNQNNACSGGYSQSLVIKKSGQEPIEFYEHTCGGRSDNQSLKDFGSKLRSLLNLKLD